MFSSTAKRVAAASPRCLRWYQTTAGSPSPYTPRNRYEKTRAAPPSPMRLESEEKSQWWIVDGEIHEIGDNVPLRERFAVTRMMPVRRRRQLREQFMYRTRLVLKENEHEAWGHAYLELYQELRENWERLYWDEGYSRKVAQDRTNHDSADEDDDDFSPYKSDPNNSGRQMRDQGFRPGQRDNNMQQVHMIRDKFEHDREKRMRENAFGSIRGGQMSGATDPKRDQQFDVQRYFPQNESRAETAVVTRDQEKDA